MVADIELLDKSIISKPDIIRKIYLPTEGETKVTHWIQYYFYKKHLSNVLDLPAFIFNLMSASKVTRELRCSVNFFPDFCSFRISQMER